LLMAERGGFEPPVELLTLRRFSKPGVFTAAVFPLFFILLFQSLGSTVTA
jgi:hypothetical protein